MAVSAVHFHESIQQHTVANLSHHLHPGPGQSLVTDHQRSLLPFRIFCGDIDVPFMKEYFTYYSLQLCHVIHRQSPDHDIREKVITLQHAVGVIGYNLSVPGRLGVRPTIDEEGVHRDRFR